MIITRLLRSNQDNSCLNKTLGFKAEGQKHTNNFENAHGCLYTKAKAYNIRGICDLQTPVQRESKKESVVLGKPRTRIHRDRDTKTFCSALCYHRVQGIVWTEGLHCLFSSI